MMLESLKNKKSGLHMNASEEEMCDDIIIEVQQSSTDDQNSIVK